MNKSKPCFEEGRRVYRESTNPTYPPEWFFDARTKKEKMAYRQGWLYEEAIAQGRVKKGQPN